jgi:hypothetical protein
MTFAYDAYLLEPQPGEGNDGNSGHSHNKSGRMLFLVFPRRPACDSSTQDDISGTRSLLPEKIS